MITNMIIVLIRNVESFILLEGEPKIIDEILNLLLSDLLIEPPIFKDVKKVRINSLDTSHHSYNPEGGKSHSWSYFRSKNGNSSDILSLAVPWCLAVSKKDGKPLCPTLD